MINKKHIDNGKEFDWGQTSKDYAKYRDIYPEEFYQKIVDIGLCTQGQKVLDLGTGSGVLPRNMYRFGAEWTGTDISENQIMEAVRLAKESNMDIDFFAAPAENTALPEHSFDVITACQCFFYFDKEKVLTEIVRMLKDNGRLLILYMTWLPFENEITSRSEKLVLKYNPSWTGGNFERYAPTVPDWLTEHFECMHNIVYDVDVPFTRESWHGRMIACRGIGASSLPEPKIEKFKKEHWEYAQTLPEAFSIPHFVTMLDLKVKYQVYDDSQSQIYKTETSDFTEHDSDPITAISFRNAGNDDVKMLAAMNHELIRDEGSENPMNLKQLEERMKDFLLTEYKADLILSDNEIAGYCLYKMENQKDNGGFDIYVRQYYIKPKYRQRGLGKSAFKILMETTFKNASFVKLDVLESNQIGKIFWSKVGFEPYCHNLRMKGSI